MAATSNRGGLQVIRGGKSPKSNIDPDVARAMTLLAILKSSVVRAAVAYDELRREHNLPTDPLMASIPATSIEQAAARSYEENHR